MGRGMERNREGSSHAAWAAAQDDAGPCRGERRPNSSATSLRRVKQFRTRR